MAFDTAARRAVPQTRVMFLYWGRRGLTQFALEAARTAAADPTIDPIFSVSRQNENFSQFLELGAKLFPIDTFSASIGALVHAWRIPVLRRQIVARLKQDRIGTVVELMPHIWSPFVMSAIRSAGARYVTIVHDAVSHSGDYRTLLAKRFLDRAAQQADVTITLSDSVFNALCADGRVPRSKVVKLFHPDLTYGPVRAPQPPQPGETLRLAFIGRIMPYKGLPLFIDSVQALQQSGLRVHAGVYGEGDLGVDAVRLKTIGAEVLNRWLTDSEISNILARSHAVVLSHTGASQSGVVAMAFGANVPVVVTPVGGLIEQVEHDVTGIVATGTNSQDLAAGIKRLLLDPQHYRSICRNIAEARELRSMAHFVRQCVVQASASDTVNGD